MADHMSAYPAEYVVEGVGVDGTPVWQRFMRSGWRWTASIDAAFRWDDMGQAHARAFELAEKGESARAVPLRTHDAAPAEKLQASERDEATETGGPARGSGRPGRSRSERHAAPAGAAEVDLPPEPGDLESSGAHYRPAPEMSSSGATPRGPVQLQLYASCEVCHRPIPATHRRYCDGECRNEAIRRRRFERRKAVSP